MRVARLSILESYGVRWTRETFARDLLQNFFDSAADFRAVALDVRDEEGVVEIRGPETFDLDLLAYIGATTKTSGRTVGGFGEGFKICALVGARDFGLAITAGSGAEEIAVFFDPVPLGRELCYRVTTRAEGPFPGSFVRLEGCDAATIAAFRSAPAMFRHPENPRLREPLVVDLEQGVGVYAAPAGEHGELYYRRQLRGTARFYAARGERPLTLAHDGIIDELEGDRDRRDLPAEPIAYAVGEKLAPEDLHRVLLELMPYWKNGNDVLSGLLRAGAERKLRFAWPPRWLARATDGRGLNEFAERQGFSIALADFAELGMPTPGEHYTDLETRAPTPLERARFQAVARLYEDLLGQPARVSALEVFDSERAAILGQHLGDKIIVGAQLFAKGFDAVGGTVLHELAHETGGEEDIRFLRRLTNLLGAALREPEKVRAARRRYAAARPLRAAAREGASRPDRRKPYQPEQGFGPCPADGVVCTLVVPLGFPPSAQILAALREAGEAAGVAIRLQPVAVNGPVGAVTWRAPGIPTLFVGGVDPAPPPPDRAAPGYRVRTYGPEGAAFWPDREALVAALRRAREEGRTGQAGYLTHYALTEGNRERVRETLGIELPEPRRPAPSRRAERDREIRMWVVDHLGSNGGFGLDDVWNHGLQSAAHTWIRAARRDGRDAVTIYREIVRKLHALSAHAEELRDADPDFDDADTFERDAMQAAMGAAVSVHALEDDDAAGKARARAAFRAVRAATERLLDLDVSQEGKPVILLHAMKAAGLGYSPVPRTQSFEPGRFAGAFDLAEAEAVRLQRWIDEEGGFFSHYDLTNRLKAVDPDWLEAKGARMQARLTRATHAAREAYERTLARSGSAIDAAARALTAAARRMPEPVR